MLDLVKQVISSLLSAALPTATNPKLFQLPFVNPQVPADLWLITAVLTFVASFLTYGLVKPQTLAPVGTPAPPASTVSVVFATIGFIVAVLALISLIVITQRLGHLDAGLESVLNRIAYVALFVGMGPPLGWGLGRALG